MTDGPQEPDIRFLLANERTFLAWVRTAIGLVAAGVAVFHLFDDSTATTTLALVLLAAGAFAGLQPKAGATCRAICSSRWAL